MAELTDTEKKMSSSSSSSSPVPNQNVAANNNTGGDLFSPTSAAAWALSTLHNFGAAAPNDTGARPTTDSLIGTRLFNNADATSADAPRVPAETPGPKQINNAADVMPGPTTQAAASVTWGQPQFQHPNNVSIGTTTKLDITMRLQLLSLSLLRLGSSLVRFMWNVLFHIIGQVIGG